MFHKVVWATDGSDSADRALELATSLVYGNGGTLLAVHSVERLAGPGGHGAPLADTDEYERLEKIKQQVAELARQGVAADLKVVEGGVHSAAHPIADVADEEHADLIVAGTRGQTPLKGLMLGSVTQRLLHIAHCPVLVAPRDGFVPRGG